MLHYFRRREPIKGCLQWLKYRRKHCPTSHRTRAIANASRGGMLTHTLAQSSFSSVSHKRSDLNVLTSINESLCLQSRQIPTGVSAEAGPLSRRCHRGQFSEQVCSDIATDSFQVCLQALRAAHQLCSAGLLQCIVDSMQKVYPILFRIAIFCTLTNQVAELRTNWETVWRFCPSVSQTAVFALAHNRILNMSPRQQTYVDVAPFSLIPPLGLTTDVSSSPPTSIIPLKCSRARKEPPPRRPVGMSFKDLPC